MLLEEVIPFIEKNYRVKADRRCRAMAGLSMGSEQTSVIGFTHPEMFTSLGLFSGFMRIDTKTPFYDCPHLRLLMDDPAYIRRHYDVFFRSMGSGDTYFPVFLEDREHLRTLGCLEDSNCIERVYEGLTHDWGAFRRGMRDFARLLFRNEAQGDLYADLPL